MGTVVSFQVAVALLRRHAPRRAATGVGMVGVAGGDVLDVSSRWRAVSRIQKGAPDPARRFLAVAALTKVYRTSGYGPPITPTHTANTMLRLPARMVPAIAYPSHTQAAANLVPFSPSVWNVLWMP